MKKQFASLIFLLLISNTSFAAFTAPFNVTLLRVHQNGFVEFGITDNPHTTGTCDYFGYKFRFDSNTIGGKHMLSLLMSAKVSGQKIHIWYSESTAVGSDETNGCTPEALAVPESVALHLD